MQSQMELDLLTLDQHLNTLDHEIVDHEIDDVESIDQIISKKKNKHASQLNRVQDDTEFLWNPVQHSDIAQRLVFIIDHAIPIKSQSQLRYFLTKLMQIETIPNNACLKSSYEQQILGCKLDFNIYEHHARGSFETVFDISENFEKEDQTKSRVDLDKEIIISDLDNYEILTGAIISTGQLENMNPKKIKLITNLTSDKAKIQLSSFTHDKRWTEIMSLHNDSLSSTIGPHEPLLSVISENQELDHYYATKSQTAEEGL